MQTQRCVFAHPELFRWAGIFSGGLTIRNEEADYSSILWIVIFACFAICFLSVVCSVPYTLSNIFYFSYIFK